MINIIIHFIYNTINKMDNNNNNNNINIIFEYLD